MKNKEEKQVVAEKDVEPSEGQAKQLPEVVAHVRKDSSPVKVRSPSYNFCAVLD